MSFIRRLLVFAAVGVCAAMAWSQDPPKQDPAPAPAPQDPAREDIEAVIVEIKGVVDVKRPADKDWVAAEKNMKLPRGSELCTGASSSAKLVFAKGLTVELRSVTMANLVNLYKKAQSLTVDTTIKFGSAEIKLEKTEVKADMQVATPAVTTSISGSHGIIRGWATLGEQGITLRILEGIWSRLYNGTGITQEGHPGDSFNDFGDLPSEIDYQTWVRIIEIYGRNRDELINGGNWSEFLFGLNPFFEFGQSNYNPALESSENGARQLLPPPPGPPSTP